MARDYEKYPEHAKQSLVQNDINAIIEFLDTSGYLLAQYKKVHGYKDSQLIPAVKSTTEIVAKYFNIDLDKLEAEKVALLDELVHQTTLNKNDSSKEQKP